MSTSYIWHDDSNLSESPTGESTSQRFPSLRPSPPVARFVDPENSTTSTTQSQLVSPLSETIKLYQSESGRYPARSVTADQIFLRSNSGYYTPVQDKKQSDPASSTPPPLETTWAFASTPTYSRVVEFAESDERGLQHGRFSTTPIRRRPVPLRSATSIPIQVQNSERPKSDSAGTISDLPLIRVESSTEGQARYNELVENQDTVGGNDVTDLPESIDVGDLKFQDLGAQDPEVRKVIVEATQEFRSRPTSRVQNFGDTLQPTPRLSKVPSAASSTQGDENSDEERDPYCCDVSRNATQQDFASIHFCPGCQAIFCKRCWRKQTSHKGKGALGHEKTRVEVAKWASATLAMHSSDEEQAFQHLVDKNSALWFGAGRDEAGVPVFYDSERYSTLMSERQGGPRDRCFPALAAVVGETSAGKSSLIKLLISMFNRDGLHQTPVVGSATNDHIPTSGDVHLYCDPNTFNSSDPILYADCEGLNGGTREPIAAKYKRRHSGNSEALRTQDPALRRQLRQDPKSTEREIMWADSPERSSREYFVRHFYPRLLYTFSDVIVFVVRNVRAIENVIAQLITWADAVLEASSNQPVLPHAIIVLNAVNNNPTLWEVPAATNDLLNNLEEALDTNALLKKHMQRWRKRGVAIDSMRQLLHAYYSSVSVVRIPTGDHPSLLRDQVIKLYEEVRKSSKASLEFKLSVRMKLSSEQLQPYLHSAFDHFCHTLKTPFDFVKASHANGSIPPDFGGNILKLSLNIMQMKRWAHLLDGPLLFKELSFILASCLMLDAVRRGILGLAEGMFVSYAIHFDEALEDFCDRYWPCEYVCSRGRCVNVRAGHSKGHQIASAEVVEPNAKYEATFTAASYRQHFFNDVYLSLVELLKRLGAMKKEKGLEEKDAAVELHKDSVLKHFYRHLGGADLFFSHSTCLACLVFAPQHCLPCGHILCSPCVQAFGRVLGQTAVELSSCPLHDDAVFHPKHVIAMQPETAGLRVLSFDGGGIRGVMELETLLHIERELGGHLRVQSFFDLIVGTSTGGIIALGLGEKNWALRDCFKRFTALANRVFVRKPFSRLAATDMIFTIVQQGKYDAKNLESVLIDQFGHDRLFGGTKEQVSLSKTPRPKVAVTATSMDGTPYVFGNYNRPNTSEHLGYEFLRAETPEQEIGIHEAARATSAAPKLFKPFEHSASKQTFIDGGIYHNNPIDIAMQELRFAFPEVGVRPPDIVVSIGTGKGVDKPKRVLGLPLTPKYFKNLTKIAQDHVRHSLDSEKTWDEFISKQSKDQRARYFRMNFELGDKCPKPDDISKMEHLRQVANEQLWRRKQEIKDIASCLVATSFYFRPSHRVRKSSNGHMILHGYIECKFPSGSDEVFDLGNLFLKRKKQLYNNFGNGSNAEEGLSFVFEEFHKEKYAKQVFIDNEIIKTMTNEGKFAMREQCFEISNELAQVDIYFCMSSESYKRPHNSISGFPRCWDVDYRPKLRPSLSLSRKRAVGIQKKRPDWSKPDASLTGLLDSYANNYWPGLATDSDISRVEQRLREPEDVGSSTIIRAEEQYGIHEAIGDTHFRRFPFSSSVELDGRVESSETVSPIGNHTTASSARSILQVSPLSGIEFGDLR